MTIDQGDSHVEDGQIVYDYVYMVWKVNSVFTSHDKDNAEITEITQKYDFSLTSDAITATNSKGESITGEIIGYNLSGQNKWTAWDGNGETAQITGLVGKSRDDYVLVKYKKEDVNKFETDGKTPITVTFENSADNKIEPQGELDKDEGSASGAIVYSPPKYTAPVDIISLSKVGKFGGNNNVGGENDVSYYSLEKLKDKGQAIENLKYYVKASASVLPETFKHGVEPTETIDDVEFYQWQDALYTLIDDTKVKPLVLTDLYSKTSNELTEDDYNFTQIEYELLISKGKYDVNEMNFTATEYNDDENPESRKNNPTSAVINEFPF